MTSFQKIYSCLASPRHFIRHLSDEMKTTLVIAVVGLTHGLIYSFDTVYSYFYRDDYHLAPAQSSFIDGCNQFAWMIKPAFGALSDNFFLFGYRRKSYLMLTGTLCWICILNFGLWLPPLALGITILLLLNISMSFENCMAEAVLVQSTQTANKAGITEKDKVKTASNGVSTWFGMQYIGKIIGGCLIMSFLQESKRHTYLFWGSLAPLLGVITAILLPEKKHIKNKDSRGPRLVQSAKANIELEPSDERTRPESLEDEPVTNAATSINNIKRTIEFVKNPIIYKAVLLVFLNGFAPRSDQTKFYYYTLYLGFDASFIGSLKLISYVAVFVGVMVYNRYLKHINMKSFYTATALIGCLLNISQLILIFRLNLQLGIPDKFFAALDTLMIEMTLQFHSLPVLVLACRICPKNIEATVFALLMSVCSMSYMASLQSGALLTHLLGIEATNFDNLWILILTTSVFYLVPLTVLQMIRFEDAIKHANDLNHEEEPKNDVETASPDDDKQPELDEQEEENITEMLAMSEGL